MIKSTIDLLSQYRRAVSTLAAMAFYGSWAFFVNVDDGFGQAVFTTTIYTLYAGISTFLFSFYMDRCFRWLHPKSLAGPVTAATAAMSMVTLAWTVNFAAGTANIFLTILPGIIVGTVFSITYVAAIKQQTIQVS